MWQGANMVFNDPAAGFGIDKKRLPLDNGTKADLE
jgi:hypothetical protein